MDLAVAIIGIVLCIFASLVCLMITLTIVFEIFRKLRRPTPREKAEMENTEYDYGHNVKNYTEEDYE